MIKGRWGGAGYSHRREYNLNRNKLPFFLIVCLGLTVLKSKPVNPVRISDKERARRGVCEVPYES